MQSREQRTRADAVLEQRRNGIGGCETYLNTSVTQGAVLQVRGARKRGLYALLATTAQRDSAALRPAVDWAECEASSSLGDVRRASPRQRCAPDVLVSGRSIRLAATVRPAMTRAALLGGVWLGALAAFATNDAHAQQGPFLYVPNSGAVSNSVTVIDTPTNTSVPPPIAVGNLPGTAAVRGDEALAYVTNQGNNTVSVINTATNTVLTTVGVGTNPVGVAVSPDGTRA
jgi:YVTN family beta-propeller protein